MTRTDGFTLIDITMATVITGMVMAMAIPILETARERYQLNSAAREVAAELRSARLVAISTNRSMQVRFDCPAPRQYRVIELTGNPAIDGDPNRCSLTAYPFPSPNLAVAPTLDGPGLSLPGQIVFGQPQDVQIDRAGRVTPLGGVGAMPATVGVASPHEARNVVVSVSGRVQIP
jgi:type II secretory pathway pseudopilin PulG